LGCRQGEDLIIASVVCDQVFLDELIPGVVNDMCFEVEMGLDSLFTIETHASPIGGQAQKGIEELCRVRHVSEEAVNQDSAGDPCEGSFDGSDSAGS
jgi:hypothetical protein